MKKVFFVIVSTEDGEEYKFAYSSKPSKKSIKDDFFEHTGSTYESEDWGVCISHEIFELEVRD